MLTRPYKILVVDDDDDACEVVAEMIRRNTGQDTVQIETETCSKRAKSRLQKGDVRILVTDMNMPYFNGYDLLSEALGHPGTSCIVFTGDMSLSVSLACYKDGAYSILPKPINPKKLAQVIAELVNRLDDWAAIFNEYSASHRLSQAESN